MQSVPKAPRTKLCSNPFLIATTIGKSLVANFTTKRDFWQDEGHDIKRCGFCEGGILNMTFLLEDLLQETRTLRVGWTPKT